MTSRLPHFNRPDTAGMQGFTYIAILIAVAVLSATLASAGIVWHTAQQRERERELLFVGDQFRQAIGRYYNASPAGAKQFPQRLEDLLRDPRQPGTVRYLRKIYYDPITGTTDWGIVRTAGDGIVGVYSQSGATPLKQAEFTWSDRAFEGKGQYSQWVFNYQSVSSPLPSRSPTPAANDAAQGKQWSSTNY